MRLIRNLLDARRESILLFKSRALCSCGAIFENGTNDVENHLVKHNRIDGRAPETDTQELIECLTKTLDILKHELNEKRECTLLGAPAKTYLVLLDPSEFSGGPCESLNCPLCNETLSSFPEISCHFQKYHPRALLPMKESWSDVIFSKTELKNKPKKGMALYGVYYVLNLECFIFQIRLVVSFLLSHPWVQVSLHA